MTVVVEVVGMVVLKVVLKVVLVEVVPRVVLAEKEIVVEEDKGLV